jgi:hypothetical protein
MQEGTDRPPSLSYLPTHTYSSWCTVSPHARPPKNAPAKPQSCHYWLFERVSALLPLPTADCRP